MGNAYDHSLEKEGPALGTNLCRDCDIFWTGRFFLPFKIYKSNLLQQVGIKGRAGIARD